MAIAVGSRIPDVEVRTMGEGGPEAVRTGAVLGTGRVVLFGVPGAFTPGCSKVHLPGYVENVGALRSKGVDVVACIAVNDAWVMDAWGDAQGATGKIVMLADGNAEFARAMGLDTDMGAFGLGVRTKRYAALIEDGIVKELDVEEGGGVDVSACKTMLAHL